MNVLITGDTGFIGKGLMSILEKNFIKYVPFKRKQNYHNNIQEIVRMVQEYQIDTILHLATNYNDLTIDTFDTILQANFVLSMQLWYICTEFRIKLININTFFAYQSITKQMPLYLYIYGKRTFANLLRKNEKKLLGCSLVFGDNYGLNDTRNKIFYFLNEQYASSKTQIITLKSLKNQILYPLYIEDTYKAIIICLRMPMDNFKEYSVLGREITLEQLINTYNEVWNKKVKVKYGDSYIAPPNNLPPLLPDWHPTINLKNGIKILKDNFNKT